MTSGLLSKLADRLGGRSSPVRGRTQARVMRAIAQQLGTGTRDLAQVLEVSAGTVSKAVAQLRDVDLVRLELPGGHEKNRLGRGPGRPVVPIFYTRTYACIGITIGDRVVQWPHRAVPAVMFGTVIGMDGQELPGMGEVGRCAVLDDAAAISRTAFVEQIESYASKLKSVAHEAGAQVLGCGVTVGGHVDRSRKMILQSYNTLRGAPPDRWAAHDQLNVQEELERRLDMTVILDNDATSLAVRANLRSTPYEQPYRNYLLLPVLDEGLGGAVVLDGSVWRGAYGMAAEPGHLPVESVATVSLEGSKSAELRIPECRCGQLGHVEAFAAPRAILERYREHEAASGQVESIDELAAKSRADKLPSELFLQGGVALGRTIATAINWINPERIVIYLPPALDEVNEYLAGSNYLSGLRQEISVSAFSEGRETPVTVIRSTAERMNERLAAGAAYLVFGELIDRTAVAGKSLPI